MILDLPARFFTPGAIKPPVKLTPGRIAPHSLVILTMEPRAQMRILGLCGVHPAGGHV